MTFHAESFEYMALSRSGNRRFFWYVKKGRTTKIQRRMKKKVRRVTKKTACLPAMAIVQSKAIVQGIPIVASLLH